MKFLVGIVLYNPDRLDLSDCLVNLLELGLLPVVFDNSDDPEIQRRIAEPIRALFGDRVVLLSEGRNIGLSAAYNRVVALALADPGAEGVIFLDQDSGVPRQSVANLLATYQRLAGQGYQIGVLSGMAMRPDGIPYRVYAATSDSDESTRVHSVKMAPSSFSLVPVGTFREVGLFYDDFFIDHIDVDYCYRCRSRDYMVAVDPSAPFPHQIGHGLVFVLGYPVTPISSPFRHYYQTRNILLSARRRGVSWPVALAKVAKRLVVIGVLGIKAGLPVQRYRFALRGLRDGLRGRGGSIQDTRA